MTKTVTVSNDGNFTGKFVFLTSSLSRRSLDIILTATQAPSAPSVVTATTSSRPSSFPSTMSSNHNNNNRRNNNDAQEESSTNNNSTTRLTSLLPSGRGGLQPRSGGTQAAQSSRPAHRRHERDYQRMPSAPRYLHIG